MFRSIGLLIAASCLLLACVACDKANSAPEAGNNTQVQADNVPSTVATPANETAKKEIPDKVVVTYFHGDYRCPTCTKLESLAVAAVNAHFAPELENGKVEWRVLNTDQSENAHFKQDYQLYTKSLIVSAEKDGKEIGWKNLKKIWDLVRTPQDYDTYVAKEVKAYLDGV